MAGYSGLGGRMPRNAQLSAYPIDVIICSHLKRCLQTITPFRATGDYETMIDPAWAERSWGVYEGVSKLQRGHETHPNGGESEVEFRHRIKAALVDLRRRENVLLVSHSGVFRVLCH